MRHVFTLSIAAVALLLPTAAGAQPDVAQTDTKSVQQTEGKAPTVSQAAPVYRIPVARAAPEPEQLSKKERKRARKEAKREAREARREPPAAVRTVTLRAAPRTISVARPTSTGVQQK